MAKKLPAEPAESRANALTRRKVLELSAVAAGAAMTGALSVLASACSSDDGGTTRTPTGTTDGGASSDSGAKTDAATGADAGSKADSGPAGLTCKSSITQNHGHTITIPAADLDSSTSKTYSIIGTSDHDHQVTLAPSDFAELKAKVSVKKTSTNGGTTHDHEVTILCT